MFIIKKFHCEEEIIIVYYLTLCPFGNFLVIIRVEQLTMNILMLFQFMEILAHQNGLNQRGVANFPIHFVLDVSGPYVMNNIITRDT